MRIEEERKKEALSSNLMALEEEKTEMEMAVKDIEEEDDELGSKERVLYKYFLLEWKLVSSLLNDIVSHGRVTDPSSVYTIRSIVLSLSLSLSDPFFVSLRLMLFEFVLNIYYVYKCGNELLGSQCDTSAVCSSFGFGSFFVFHVFFSINFTLHSLF